MNKLVWRKRHKEKKGKHHRRLTVIQMLSQTNKFGIWMLPLFLSGDQIVNVQTLLNRKFDRLHLNLHCSSLDCSIWNSFCSFFLQSNVLAKVLSFLLWFHSCSKKVPVETDSSLSVGGAITFLALFPPKLQRQNALRVVERVNFLFDSLLIQYMTSEESYIR